MEILRRIGQAAGSSADASERRLASIMIDNLDDFVENPRFDPHGDPIPNANGEIQKIDKLLLSDAVFNQNYICVGVKNSSVEFLQYLDKKNIFLGVPIKVISSEKFDQSLTINLNSDTISISNKIAENLYIKLQ